MQSETGELRRCGVSMPFEVLPFDKDKYPLLSSIAPYYDTFLNPDQLVMFIAEWDAAVQNPKYRARLQEWQAVRDLAAKCQSEQLYLRFIGD